jgi:hypothetical protein
LVNKQYVIIDDCCFSKLTHLYLSVWNCKYVIGHNGLRTQRLTVWFELASAWFGTSG